MENGDDEHHEGEGHEDREAGHNEEPGVLGDEFAHVDQLGPRKRASTIVVSLPTWTFILKIMPGL